MIYSRLITLKRVARSVLVFIILFIVFKFITDDGGPKRTCSCKHDEVEAAAFIDQMDKRSALMKNKLQLAQWEYLTNITKENENFQNQVALEYAQSKKLDWQELMEYKWQDFKDLDLKRKFKKYSLLKEAVLSDDKFKQLRSLLSTMETNYATSKICDFKNKSKCTLSLDPEVTQIFSTSHDPEELKSLWVQWHQKAGASVKSQFVEYVELSNEAARLNNFTDVAEEWLYEYDQSDFDLEMGRIWFQIKPLYLQIHAYVRKKLWDKYGERVLSRKGPIPAHLLGNMWAQDWSAINSISKPYPDSPDLDITEALIAQNYTALKIFQTAENFFKSLNLTEMPPKFWENSVIVKPTDGREMVCHAAADDFCDEEDFRIKMCTKINTEDFTVVHHEMGHIEYFLQYRHLPDIYRTGANPGFHEAIGDTISLSVKTIKHLRKLNLLPPGPDDTKAEINQLYSKGIEKIVFLPFAYMLDTYRYAIFRGETTPENYNCHFWKLRESLQGLEPPVIRTEDHFDAGAKYHVCANVEYARYYVSYIIQFQFHRTLCEKAGEYVPGDETKKLTNCDIYKNAEAGKALGELLRMGASRPWQDAMEVLTGQRSMDAGALLEYFKPLHHWLEVENERTGELIGWEPSNVQYCTESHKTARRNHELK